MWQPRASRMCCTLTFHTFPVLALAPASSASPTMYGHSCSYAYRGGCLLFTAEYVSWAVLLISKGKATDSAWSGAAMKPWVFPRHGNKLPDLSPTQKCPCDKPLFALPAAALKDQSQGHVRVVLVRSDLGSPVTFALLQNNASSNC